MATQDQFTQTLNKINEATNRIEQALDQTAVKIQQLKDQISNMGLSAEQETTLLTSLESVSTVITAQADKAGQIASDPNNPVP